MKEKKVGHCTEVNEGLRIASVTTDKNEVKDSDCL